MAHRFDATLKDIVTESPIDFADEFGFPKLEPAQSINVDLSTISAATDVALGLGDPLQEIVDLNFQSGPDKNLPARVHLYNAAFHLHFGVPVRSIVILLRPKADGPHINGKLTYGTGDSQVEFRYAVVRMWERPVEPFLSGPVNLLPLATLCQVPEGMDLQEWLRQVVCEIDRRLTREKDHAVAVRLMTASFILAGMRTSKESMKAIFKGVQMIQESTAYDMILDEGRAEGRVEGLMEGRVEGLMEARLEAIVRLATKKFGTPSEQVIDNLKAIDDFERLGRLLDAILTANSWQELLSTP